MGEQFTDADRARAIMQGAQNAATDAYIEARPQLDSIHNRRIFEAGFERGWYAATTIPEGWQLIRSDLVAFLDGSGEIDGLAFGDADTSKPRPRYWWRALLNDTPNAAAPKGETA